MYVQIEKPKDNKSRSFANSVTLNRGNVKQRILINKRVGVHCFKQRMLGSTKKSTLNEESSLIEVKQLAYINGTQQGHIAAPTTLAVLRNHLRNGTATLASTRVGLENPTQNSKDFIGMWEFHHINGANTHIWIVHSHFTKSKNSGFMDKSTHTKHKHAKVEPTVTIFQHQESEDFLSQCAGALGIQEKQLAVMRTANYEANKGNQEKKK